ncbi:MAG: hypothetical protein ABL927_09285 [Bdellovibrionales bacterium]
MGSIFFVLRALVVTFLLVIVMQVRWGESTIESTAMEFLTSSTVVKPIDETASGIVVFIRNSWSRFTKSINTNFSNAMRSENQPGSRHLGFSFERTSKSAMTKAEQYSDKAVQMAKRAKSRFIDERITPGKNSDLNESEGTESQSDLRRRSGAAATGDSDEAIKETTLEE